MIVSAPGAEVGRLAARSRQRRAFSWRCRTCQRQRWLGRRQCHSHHCSQRNSAAERPKHTFSGQHRDILLDCLPAGLLYLEPHRPSRVPPDLTPVYAAPLPLASNACFCTITALTKVSATTLPFHAPVSRQDHVSDFSREFDP